MTAGLDWFPRAALLLFALAPASCKTDSGVPAAEAGVVTMRVGREEFTLEIADTPRKQQLGLMHRKSMPRDRGMLFVFPEERERSFWMKNTHIPLDIIYADTKGKVVSVKPMQPLDEIGVTSDGPAKYAIELNQGAAARAGITKGDMLTIPSMRRRSGERHNRDR